MITIDAKNVYVVYDNLLDYCIKPPLPLKTVRKALVGLLLREQRFVQGVFVPAFYGANGVVLGLSQEEVNSAVYK